MAAITAVMAQISIPMPLGVPMTMQTFAVTLAGIILGAKAGALSMIIYLLIGAVGIPVFASMTGGIQKLVGPTGGFLISFPVMALLIGIGVRYYQKSKALFILFLILGTAVNYAVGVIMFCFLMNSTVTAALTACVIPFLPTAVIKALLAGFMGIKVRRALESSGMIPVY